MKYLVKPKKRRSSITIVVVWTLFFLAILGASFYLPLTLRINIVSKIFYPTKTYYLAKAGVQHALGQLFLDDTPDYDYPSDPWSYEDKAFQDKKFGDGEFSIISYPKANIVKYGLIDQESKININKVSLTVIKNIFKYTANISEDDAISIAQSIIDWRDEDNDLQEKGAEDEYYISLSNAQYHCKNRPLELLDELLLVKGITPEILQAVKYYITVFGEGKINVNTASKEVMLSIGLPDIIVKNILDFRNGGKDKEGVLTTGFFTDLLNLQKILKEDYNLKEEDLKPLVELIDKKLLTVSSNYFEGESVGYLTKGPNYAITKIFFITQRNHLIQYWHQSYQEGELYFKQEASLKDKIEGVTVIKS